MIKPLIVHLYTFCNLSLIFHSRYMYYTEIFTCTFELSLFNRDCPYFFTPKKKKKKKRVILPCVPTFAANEAKDCFQNSSDCAQGFEWPSSKLYFRINFTQSNAHSHNLCSSNGTWLLKMSTSVKRQALHSK